ncbi:hypothetical protein BDZ91DRAFT_759360 [Kalaharituber pfeilii]|nr:hypothetical protein BDZ91DRAFT_759360 [Kalaharituber pfeilii]
MAESVAQMLCMGNFHAVELRHVLLVWLQPHHGLTTVVILFLICGIFARENRWMESQINYPARITIFHLPGLGKCEGPIHHWSQSLGTRTIGLQNRERKAILTFSQRIRD